MKTEELIKELNELKIQQTFIDWIEDIPSDLYNKYFKDGYGLDEELDVDKHRWYALSTDIYIIIINDIEKDDIILGIRRVSDLYSEEMSVEDVNHTLEFFEMERIKTISYERI